MPRLLSALALAALLPLAVRAQTTDVIGYLRAHPEASWSKVMKVQPAESYGQIRPVLMSPVPNDIQVPVTIPPGAELRFGIALRDTYLGENLIPKVEPTRATVDLVLPGDKFEKLWERVFDIRDTPADRRWLDVRVDLSRWAGQTVRLRLRDELAARPDRPGQTFVLWHRPRIYVPAEQRQRPNVLFITIDALRADHLTCYGYDRPTSPRLDQLAREGVRFANAFTSAPMTVPSLPQIFTSAYFPTFLSPNLLSTLFAGGVERTKSITNNPYLRHWMTLQTRDSFDSISATGWRGDRITNAALEWLDVHGKERFGLYLHYLDTHTPYRTPMPDATMFADPDYHGKVPAHFADVEGAQQGAYDAADRKEIIALYDGAIHFVDREIGRLLDGLAERGLAANTLVVVSADHGEELWDHGGFFHGQSLYDELLHVPLLVRLPAGAHAGRVVEPQVRSVDIVPTIADVLGTPVLPEFQGSTLAPLAGGAASEPRPDFARAANPRFPYRFGLRANGKKLITTVSDGREELYDLTSDPGEHDDRAGDPAMAGTLKDMRETLHGYERLLRHTGFQVRAVAGDGAEHHIVVTVRAEDANPENPDRIDLAPSDRLAFTTDQHALEWTGTVGATPSGFRFDRGLMRELHADPGTEFRFQENGVDLPAAAIHLGDGTRPAPASPFRFKIVPPALFGEPSEEPPLATATPPDVVARPGEAVSVYVWRAPDAGPAASAGGGGVDASSRQRLRALGYAE